VVEFPGVLVEVVAADVFPRQATMTRGSDPAVMVDGAIAAHLEVRRVTLLRRLRSCKAVQHADAFDRLLRDALRQAVARVRHQLTVIRVWSRHGAYSPSLAEQ